MAVIAFYTAVALIAIESFRKALNWRGLSRSIGTTLVQLIPCQSSRRHGTYGNFVRVIKISDNFAAACDIRNLVFGVNYSLWFYGIISAWRYGSGMET
jgi:hypothetical protein